MALPGNHNSNFQASSSSLNSRSISPSTSPQITAKTSSHGVHSIGRTSSNKEHSYEKSDQEPITTEPTHRNSISEQSKHECKPLERIKKKTPWYSSLYPTYKSRSEDFKRIFRELPADERLIVDYSCAIQRDILVHGRLYASQRYLCFYANIFRWETQVIIKWREVTAITKEKTALVIPNAIFVHTLSDKYFLTSFAARDKTYLMLFRIWQNALLEQPLPMQEMWQWVHSCYGNELGLTSDDDDYVAPSPLNNTSSDSKTSTKHSAGSLSEESKLVAAAKEPQNYEEKSATDDKQIPLSDQVPTDISDTSESDLGQGEIPTCPIVHEGRMLVHEIIPVNVDQLFTLIFTNSKFAVDFHEARKNTDVKLSPWQENPSSKQKTRTVSLTVPLSQPVGPKQSQVTETQVMLSCSKPGEMYAIEVESMNAGIPYADSFYIATHFCLTRGSHSGETLLAVYCQIKYRKSVWGFVKGFIEKNCWAGLEEFYMALVKALEAECERQVYEADTVHASDNKRKSVRRKRGVKCSAGVYNQSLAEDKQSLPVLLPPTSSLVAAATDPLLWLVFCILFALLLLNAFLYYKLWCMEQIELNIQHSSIIDLHLQRHIPHTQEEWIKLLQQQEKIHNSEITRWQKVLKSVTSLLKQAEESLQELQNSVHSMVSERVLSALKDISSSSEHIQSEL